MRRAFYIWACSGFDPRQRGKLAPRWDVSHWHELSRMHEGAMIRPRDQPRYTSEGKAGEGLESGPSVRQQSLLLLLRSSS